MSMSMSMCCNLHGIALGALVMQRTLVQMDPLDAQVAASAPLQSGSTSISSPII
jgi:hypothetical protein